MDRGLRIALFSAAVAIAGLGLMSGGWHNPLLGVGFLALAIILAAVAKWPGLNSVVLRSPFALRTMKPAAQELLTTVDSSVPYAPAFTSRAAVDLVKLVPELDTVEHDHVLWRVTMPSVSDSAIGEIYDPSVEDIGVRTTPFCPKCETDLNTKAGAKPGEWEQYCVSCGWKQITSTEPMRQRNEAESKARGRYRALLKAPRPSGDVSVPADWAVKIVDKDVYLVMTNFGEDADCIARVESVWGGGNVPIPWTIRWSGHVGEDRLLQQGVPQLLQFVRVEPIANYDPSGSTPTRLGRFRFFTASGTEQEVYLDMPLRLDDLYVNRLRVVVSIRGGEGRVNEARTVVFGIKRDNSLYVAIEGYPDTVISTS